MNYNRGLVSHYSRLWESAQTEDGNMIRNKELSLEELLEMLDPDHQARKDYCKLLQDYNCMRSVLLDIGDRADDRDRHRVETLLERATLHECCKRIHH